MFNHLKVIWFITAGIFLTCNGHVLRAEDALETGQRIGMFNEYYVYTRLNFREPTRVLATAESVETSPIAFGADTIILIHGHQANAFSSLNEPLKNAFISVDDFNVISVDWSIFASQNYDAAAVAVPRIAEGLAEFINLLVAEGRVSLARLHLIGFGLGAHVAGIAGRSVTGTVARITGLDPAGPNWGSASQRLSRNDASYVEVIHTDGFTNRANGIGEDIGHVDFFPNGGRSSQPGCSNNECSHNRAWEFFESTITSDHLVGSRCASLSEMTSNRCTGPTLVMGGNEYIKYASGIYRLATTRAFPY